jgi:hypothetical protein
MTFRLLILALAFTLTGCLPEEDPWPLPEAPEEAYAEVALGEDYTRQVYFDLATGTATSRSIERWDLALSTSAEQPGIRLNGAKFVKAAPAGADFTATMTPEDYTYAADHPGGHPDSAAVRWQSLPSPVYLVDRGQLYYDGPERFFKLQVLAADDSGYTLRIGAPDDAEGQELTIPLDSTYSRMYWHRENGLLDEHAPPKDQWHLLISRYFHIYDSLPEGDPFRTYSVNGVLNHRAAGVRSLQVDTAEIPYAQAPDIDWRERQFPPAADVIGFDWKRYDFDEGYLMRGDRYYIVSTAEGAIYRLRLTDFLNAEGVKGHPAFTYQRIF